MERVQELIEKLWRQSQQKVGPEQLILTVQSLQDALAEMVRSEPQAGSAKVAVVMPPKRRTAIIAAAPAPPSAAPEPEAPAIAPSNPSPEIKQMEIPLADLKYTPSEPALLKPEQKPEPAPTPVAQAREPYLLQKPAITENAPPPTPKQEPAPPQPEREVFHLHFDMPDEAPTLVQQPQQPPVVKELHEVISEVKESLNDRLKQDKTELSHKLTASPIKDLRKAVGVNDKFLYVRELFRGDEAMYERSIKTINNFKILPEAEYWISRELKVKLGWDDSSDTVQEFYQLVKRRFA